MQKINKKGISGVVENVLLILIVIALISMIGLYINSFVKNTQLGPKFSCIDMQLSKPIEIKKACYNSTRNDLEVKVFRKIAGLEINSLDFVINANDSSSWSCSDSCGNCVILEEGDTKTYYFDLNASDGEVNLAVFNCVLDTKEFREC